MECFICACDIDKSSSFIQCHQCGKYAHYECLPIDVIACPHCKTPFILTEIIDHLSINDYRDYADRYLQHKLQVINANIAHASKIVRSYGERFDRFQDSIQQISRIKSNIERIASMSYFISEIDALKSINETIAEYESHSTDYSFIRSTRDWISNIHDQINVEDLLHTRSDITNERDRIYVRDLYRKKLIMDRIDNNDLFKAWYETDETKIDVFMYGISKHLIVNFGNECIHVYPDAQMLERLMQIETMMENEFSDEYSLIDEVPSILSFRFINTNIRGNARMSRVFSATASFLIDHQFQTSGLPINICDRCSGRVNDKCVCESCGTRYCPKCMKELIGGHICHKSDVEAWM